MRVILLLVATCMTTVAQETRPFGLLPPQSPLAPIQEALLRGDGAEARAGLDAFLASAPPEALAVLAPEAALLRAAAEPVEQRAAAMLGVATAYVDGPLCESAAVAGIAALLFDGPEVGDLDEPLLPRPDALTRERPDSARPAPPSGAGRERLLGAFLEILERRALVSDRDSSAAREHARRLLAQFPSQVSDWVRVRPSDEVRFPARLDQSLRLRLWDLGGAGGSLPDPTRVILPEGRPVLDVVLPANQDGLRLPALRAGAWLLVATGADAGDRRAWPLLVSDLEVITHSHAGKWKALALLGGRPSPEASVTTLFDPRLASRTRSPERKDPDNAILARSGAHAATAPISPPPATPRIEQEQRLVADLWAPQPVYRPGDPVRLRLCMRALDPARRVTDAPLRVVLWPRQPHEMVFEKTQSEVISLAFELPSSSPPGPVRAQVFDGGVPAPSGIAPEPILDVVAFTVQSLPADPVQLLMSAPTSWKPGAPPPRIELLGLFQRGVPASGLRASVTVAAGSFRQDVAVVLDEQGAGAVTLGLDGLGPGALDRTPQIEVTAHLEAGKTEIATSSRRIAIAQPPKEDDSPALELTTLAPKPVAGEPLGLAITGPAGETVLITVATKKAIASHEATIGESGRVEVAIPTHVRWSSAEVLASTRVVKDRRLEKRLCVTFARPDPPSVTLDDVNLEGSGEQPPFVSFHVTSKGPRAGMTVSLAVVDDRVLRFAGTGLPNPDQALRPATLPVALRAASSAAPFEAAVWYAAVLGKDDRFAAALSEARFGAPLAMRGPAAGPLGSAAQGVGGITLSGATRAFEPQAALDAQGRGRIAVPLVAPEPGRPPRTWRVIAVAIDDEGRSGVAERVVPAPSRQSAPARAERVTTVRAAAKRQTYVERASPITMVELRRFGGLAKEQATVSFHPFPDRIADAIEAHLADAFPDCADHLAATIAYEAAKWGGRRDPGAIRAPAKSLEAAPGQLPARLALLRELTTRDGYSWQRGEPTDFELTPLVLHALAVAADAGLDPAAFGALADLHDGFLRIAPRTFAEAHGNPQAALELEDLRTHAAFVRSVPPERRALVLVDTVVGMLAVDPGAGFAKLGIASLLRQTLDLPGAVLARAGLAMLRAGDRESAAIALTRLSGIQDDDPVRLALHLQLARLLETPATVQDEIAERLERCFTRAPWPPLFACALAFAELGPRRRNDPGKVERMTTDAVAAEVLGPPAIVIVESSAAFDGPIGSGGTVAPAVRLESQDEPLDAEKPALAAGSQAKIIVSVEAPAGAFAIRCPVANGMRVLRAAKGFVDSQRILWLFHGAAPGTPVVVEAVVEVSQDLDAWDPVMVISLDTLEVLGWSAGARFVVPVQPASPQASPASSSAVAMDAVALARALAAKDTAFRNALDRPARADALKDLLDLPGRDLAEALVADLPTILSLVDRAAVDRSAAMPPLAAVVAALGARRDILLSQDVLPFLDRGGRTLADLLQDDPKAGELVDRWRAGGSELTPPEARFAGFLALARLRTSDTAAFQSTWSPDVLLRLWDPSREGAAERMVMSLELPFQRHFAQMFGGAKPVDPKVVDAWIELFDSLEQRVRGDESRENPFLLPLVAALTERSAHETGIYTPAEIPFRIRQGLLREVAAARGVDLVETGGGVPELPLLTSTAAPDHVARLLGVLIRSEPPGIACGLQILRRHRESFSIDDQAGTLLATIAANGPRAWRLPAVLALLPKDRRRVPIAVIAQLLRDQESMSAAIELLVDREDSADLLKGALQLELSRREARAILDRLAAMDPRPFERTPLPDLLSLLARLDPESTKPVERELERRTEDSPAEIARALAASREERVRNVLVQDLARAQATDVPWEPGDALADKLRTKLFALAGNADAADQVRQWMKAATQSTQAQGAPDAILPDLWPALAPHATPLDVLAFGAPAQPGLIEARAAQWTDEAIAAFLRSPEARPDPAATIARPGTVAGVVRLVGPARLAPFTDDLVALWRAHVDAGLAFDALNLFGQMGAAQVAALREVLATSDPRRFSEAQQLAYVSALARDPSIHHDVEPILRASPSPEIAAALARYTLEVTGYWKEPPAPATRPESATRSAGPRTPQDWQRVLMTRIRNEGLDAITRAEPPVVEAWQKTLRERGLLMK